jgi:hypothetical protein
MLTDHHVRQLKLALGRARRHEQAARDSLASALRDLLVARRARDYVSAQCAIADAREARADVNRLVLERRRVEQHLESVTTAPVHSGRGEQSD